MCDACAMCDGDCGVRWVWAVGCGWLQHKSKDMIHLQYIVSLNKVLNHQFIPFNTWRQMRNENLQWTLIDLMNGDGMVWFSLIWA